MIKADHKKWAVFLFDFYISRLLKKNFNRFFLVNKFPLLTDNKSVIVTPNHFSWWDGFFIDYTFKKFSNKKIHLLMLEEQLKRYWFFAKVGAYSINYYNSVSVSNTISYTQKILKDPNNFVVFYPQGEIQPFGASPIILKEGLRLFIKNVSEETLVLPTAFKILYSENKNPDIFLRFGELLKPDTIKNNWGIYSDNFLDNVSELNKITPDSSFEDIFKL